jgi:hypothetical protein
MEIKYDGKKKELFQKLQSLHSTANMIADTYENQLVKEKAEKEYKEVLEEYVKTPYVVNGMGQISLQYKIEFLNDEVEFKHGETSKYSKEGKPVTIEYDNEGKPVKLKFVTQDPYLHNAPLQIEVPLTVDFNIYNDKIKIVPREVVKEKEVVKYIPKEIEIPNVCVCGTKLDDALRFVFCRNCGRDLLTIMKEIEQRKLSEKSNNKKNGKRFKFL